MIIHSAQFVTSAPDPAGYPPEPFPHIAFAGRSNVGKSSLMNTLLNRKKLVKTSATPGKTQLINFFLINKAVYFVDLPGYGFAKVPKRVQKTWGPMMDTYFKTQDNLQAVVCLVDARRDIGELDLQLYAYLEKYERRKILVFTKMDKLKTQERKQFAANIKSRYGLSPEDYFPVSSQSKSGIDALWQVIDRAIIEAGGDAPDPEDS